MCYAIPPPNFTHRARPGAGGFGPINIAPYLVPGHNLIAVFADDNLAFGANHQFIGRITIDTAAGVPTMPLSLIVLTGLLLLAPGAANRLRRRVA